MNSELIRKLAQQVPGWNCHNVYLGPYQPSLEKFAELIVQECAMLCYDKARIQADIDSVKSGYMEVAYMTSYNTIKEHFGVK